MVKKIQFKDLAEMTRVNNITVALIYNKRKKPCKEQEKELETIEKKLIPYGVKFVKLDRAKDNVHKELGVDTVPSILMWIRNGIQVHYNFERGGATYSQINSFISAEKLLKQIALLINSYN